MRAVFSCLMQIDLGTVLLGGASAPSFFMPKIKSVDKNDMAQTAVPQCFLGCVMGSIIGR